MKEVLLLQIELKNKASSTKKFSKSKMLTSTKTYPRTKSSNIWKISERTQSNSKQEKI